MSLPPDAVNEPAVRTASPLRWVVVLLALVAVLAFLLLSPGGYLSKADMVGYAVCHRIHSHSFTMAGRQLPMCARCTGTFTGALVGLMGQALVLHRRRAAQFPPAPILAVLVGFVLLMAVDGVNSYISLLPIGTSLYEPTNTLRLITGALNGLAMSAIVYPAINSTLWRDPAAERAIGAWKDLLVLLVLEAGTVGLVLTQWGPLLYPIATMSALGVLALLSSVHSVLILTITNRENCAVHWQQAAIALLAGLTASLVEIGVIDIIRYRLTGTFWGIPPLQ